MFIRNLKEKLSTAIAWGSPSAECYGMTHSELISLLSDCKKRIEYLENTLRTSGITFTETDFPK